MLTLFVLASGFYASRRINFQSEDGSAFATIDHAQIWNDLIAMLTLIGMACGWAIDCGRSTRTYFDAEILPWLERHGVNVTLPTIDLPALPWGQTETPIAE